MTRIFLTLAVFVILAMTATIIVGFASFSMEVSGAKSDTFMVHFNLGLVTVLAILLVHCIIFTYFLGTGRWVKEVGLAYQLPDQHLPKLTRELKRSTFPPALFAMLTAIGTAAAGAGAQLQEWPWYIHATAAGITFLVNLWAFAVEYANLRLNARVITEVLDEVDRIRASRGLPSNLEALEQDQ
ncbi:MAG: hypothetical protein FJ271_07770 [Planctomycetes bacterium]|nr:hypothetical protein [Planctomycetota bacterium]